MILKKKKFTIEIFSFEVISDVEKLQEVVQNSLVATQLSQLTKSCDWLAEGWELELSSGPPAALSYALLAFYTLTVCEGHSRHGAECYCVRWVFALSQSRVMHFGRNITEQILCCICIL